MAFFRKNKKNKTAVEEKTPSAEIARQRAEDIHSNYDGDDFVQQEVSTDTAKDPEDLDDLLDGNLDEEMLAFEDDVEQDLAQPLSEEKDATTDLFDDIDLSNDEGNLSEMDSSFEGLYNTEKEMEEKSLDEDVIEGAEKESEDEVREESEDEQSSYDSFADDLAKSLLDSLEDELINSSVKEEESNADGMATKSQIYMAMQVFDSESGDFNLQNVDNQLIFDTDDEDTFGFSCDKTEKVSKPAVDENDFIFDTSEDE